MTHIESIVLRNYRQFQEIELSLQEGINVFVGGNGTGKSTVLEAISLCLTGRLNGKPVFQGLTPHLFNNEAVKSYAEQVAAGTSTLPPELTVELYLSEGENTAVARGTHNSKSKDCAGFLLRADLDTELLNEYRAFLEEYRELLQNGLATPIVPVEYYRVSMLGFNGSTISQIRRTSIIDSRMVDPSRSRLASGNDPYFRRAIETSLGPDKRAQLASAYRASLASFGSRPGIGAINQLLDTQKGSIISGVLRLGIDSGFRNSWEEQLTPFIGEFPLDHIGSGDQNRLKIHLALNNHDTGSDIILVEEPENHLSYNSMNSLIAGIQAQASASQIIIATHSSMISNRLGLDKLTLLSGGTISRFDSLPSEVVEFFAILPGFDTLRLVLSERCILVEGSSDDLVVQRAFKDKFAQLPLECGVDVYSINGKHFESFLRLLSLVKTRAAIITDNDGDEESVRGKYESFENERIKVFVGADLKGKTLEYQIASYTQDEDLRRVLDLNPRQAPNGVTQWMLSNKTDAAHRLFLSSETIDMPDYIQGAVTWIRQ